MTEDFSFIKLYKNDFDSAKKADDTPVQTLPYGGFIVQKPNEYFQVTTAGATPISFVGGIQVDLINCSGEVKQNINSNFYYEGAVDSDGVEQISFAFGFIGTDFWTEQLYLKITDLVNDNIWYSNGFLVTYYRTELSTHLGFFNQKKIFNISYDLLPFTQLVRIADCYDESPANKKEQKQYVQASGRQVNYRPITTFLRKYVANAVDYFLNDRLEALFSHQFVYVNGERATVSDYKANDREGDVNWLSAEFIVNPQGEKLNVGYQIYEYLTVTAKSPIHLGIYTTDTLPAIELTFNKDITLEPGFGIQLYKDGVLQTIAPATYTPTGNVLAITPSYSFTDGDYEIVVPADKIKAGAESFAGISIGNWAFGVGAGEYDEDDYDNDEYLT